MNEFDQEICCIGQENPSHLSQIGRINRSIGQLEGIKKMIESNRYCPEIMSQLKAVRSAIKAIESNILSTHLQHCVVQSFNNLEERLAKINEIKELFIKFDE